MTFFEYLSYFPTFAGNETTMAQERQVIHLQRGEEHYYFGSVAAMYDHFNREEIGISYGSLRNYGLSPDKPYRNEKTGLFRLRGFASGGTAAYWFSSHSRMELDTPRTLL